MHDSGVVASIAADDGGGLAEAYDMYADPLYKYCLRMLGDPASAADAVQDTFAIAAAMPAGLREPGQVRAWLYAVARNECLRKARAGNAISPLGQAPDVTDADGDAPGGDAARAGLRGLFDDAAEGLPPGEREALELQLRQGLAPAEVAAVLGVSRGHAHALLSRAREQLEACLGTLLTGRAGQGGCAELASMLADWDGRLTVVLRKRLHGHVERCATCATRRVFELRPAMLGGLSPGAAMAAAAADSLRVAPGPPAALRAHTLVLATGQDPGAIAHRAAVLRRAGTFGSHGFPRPMSGTGGGALGWRGAAAGRGKRQAGAAAVLLAVAAGAVAFSLAGGGEHARLADGRPPGSAPGASPPASAVAVPDPTGPPATRPHPAATPTPTAASTPTAVSVTSGAPATGGPGTTPTASRSPATTPTSPSPSPKPPPGTLQMFPAGGPLWVPPWGATIWLSARGGPVTWRATVSPGHGSVGVSPAAGTLGDGARTVVTITADHSAAGRQVTIYPGGTVFTIVTGRGHRAYSRPSLPAVLTAATPGQSLAAYIVVGQFPFE
jgi:RNA polymerase sigma factor (sigma-70 family)